MGLFSTPPKPAVHTLRVLAHLLRYPTAELREHAGELRDALRAEAALPPARLTELDADKARVSVACDGTRVAALPWQIGDAGVEALANWYNFFVRPLGDPALLAEIARTLPLGRALLAPLPQADATALAVAMRRAGWIVLAQPCDANHFLPVRGRSFAEYWAGRPGALRETVRRKSRKGEVTLRIADTFSCADWDAYEAIYRLS